MKRILLTVTLALGSGMLGAYLFSKFSTNNSNQNLTEAVPEIEQSQAKYTSVSIDNESFVLASKKSTSSVVFIKTMSQYQRRSPFGMFFDFDPFGSIGKVSSSGSGVIMSEDGYIVTNNHVIQNADEIIVNLSGKKIEYPAKVIGTDPSTDLALLKIEAKGLLAMEFGNSEDVQIGEWVLAVGNPFNLNSTVTAGIVSAKGRNINIVQNQFPIESFIQTDAAINPGNSGGALVNLKGELVGINTAIASKTGSYAGYGFAIPSNMVSKIVKDFIDYGEVQRGFIGAIVDELTGEEIEALGNKLDNGVKVDHVYEDGPCDKAGIKPGNIIYKIQGKKITSKATYDEQLAYYRPGDNITMVVIQGGEEHEKTVKLIDMEGNTSIVKKNSVESEELGASFQKLSSYELKKLNIDNGVKINSVKGGVISRLGLSEGFVITSFNDKKVTDPEELIKLLKNANGKYKIEGVDAYGNKKYYNFYGY